MGQKHLKMQWVKRAEQKIKTVKRATHSDGRWPHPPDSVQSTYSECTGSFSKLELAKTMIVSRWFGVRPNKLVH